MKIPKSPTTVNISFENHRTVFQLACASLKLVYMVVERHWFSMPIPREAQAPVIMHIEKDTDLTDCMLETLVLALEL
ncbi:MAG: hypothetical protein R3A45_02665 [Bdellovibrionota bacterium]